MFKISVTLPTCKLTELFLSDYSPTEKDNKSTSLQQALTNSHFAKVSIENIPSAWSKTIPKWLIRISSSSVTEIKYFKCMEKKFWINTFGFWKHMFENLISFLYMTDICLSVSATDMTAFQWQMGRSLITALHAALTPCFKYKVYVCCLSWAQIDSCTYSMGTDKQPHTSVFGSAVHCQRSAF